MAFAATHLQLITSDYGVMKNACPLCTNQTYAGINVTNIDGAASQRGGGVKRETGAFHD